MASLATSDGALLAFGDTGSHVRVHVPHVQRHSLVVPWSASSWRSELTIDQAAALDAQ